MRSPLWILNSFLVLMFLGVCSLLWFFIPQIPPQQPLKVPEFSALPKMEVPQVALATIYERDPFGTSSISELPTQAPSPLTRAIPQAPMLRAVPQPVIKPATFLPPLSITLKGIMASSNEYDNRAIIADQNTKEEKLYRVGDSILDAELIRIESNKILLIRSNGQQEMVFMSAPSASHDPLYQQASAQFMQTPPIKKESETTFIVDPELFSTYVMNLAQLIDILDITAAFEQEKCIGCRIGALQHPSIGTLLGLQTGDIITYINDVPTNSAQNRIAIYQQITHMKLEDRITVQLLRNQEKLAFTYTLKELHPKKVLRHEQEAAQNFLKGKPLSPEVSQKIHKQNKRAMFEQGGSSHMSRSPYNP
jgi:type II secretory pathway component PulC